MKKILFLSIAVFSISVSFSQTTVEEYNYVTKGYKVQLESGLDMKKGYEFQNLETTTVGERTCELKKLLKSSTGKVAAYLIIYKRTGYPAEYICVPHKNSSQEVLQAYFNKLGEFAIPSLQVITYTLTDVIDW